MSFRTHRHRSLIGGSYLVIALLSLLVAGGCGGGGSSALSAPSPSSIAATPKPSHAPTSTPGAGQTHAPSPSPTASSSAASSPTPMHAASPTATPVPPTPTPRTSPEPTPTPTPPPTRTYYVDPAGKDSNPGTARAPFATIEKAASVVVPGNTVIVDNGTYTGSYPSGCAAAVQCYVALISTGGTASQPITFQAANRQGAIIDGNGFTTQYCIGTNTGVAYVNIIGFEIAHCGVSGISVNQTLNHDILIAHNHVEHIAETNNCSPIGDSGINAGVGTYNITIDANMVNDVGRLATSNCSPSSLAYTNDHLLYLKGHNQTVINNVLYDAHSGWSMQIASGPPPDGPGWLIANNTIGASNNPLAYGDIVIDDTGAGVATSSGTMSNNIAISPTTVFLDLYNPHPGSVWTMDNNLFGTNVTLAAGAGAANATINAAGNLNDTNPLVVSTALPNPNFALQAGSPALGAGIYLPAVTRDFTGAGRFNPPSIGAYDQ